MARDEATTFDAEFISETDLAILVDIDGDEVWLPKSQIEMSDGSLDAGDLIEIDVPDWLAEEKGLL